MSESKLSPKDALDHAWRYFALHAGQRMSMFNYFLILFGIVAAGLGGCLRVQGVFRLVGVLLGAVLATVALVFWKLDQRSGFLVKHAEDALRKLEEDHVAESARLFQKEPEDTKDAQTMAQWFFRMWTYGRSFRFVFVVAGLVGIVGAGLSIALHLKWCE